MDEESCQNCHSNEWDETLDGIDGVCDSCGLVVNDIGSFSEGFEDYKGSIDESQRRKDRETTWGEFYTVSNSTEKQIAEAIEVLEEVADHLNLSSDVRRDAANIYCDAAKELITDGRRTDLIVTSALYISAKRIGAPRPLGNCAQAIDSEKPSVSSLVKLLHRELEIDYPLVQVREYVPYLSQSLSLRENHAETAKRLVDEAENQGLTNAKGPSGFAGAALYLCSNAAVSQREVAGACGVTKETIRKRLSEIRPIYDDW